MAQEHFDPAKVPTWNSLTDSERHWLGLLGRVADNEGMVKEWYYSQSMMFFEGSLQDPLTYNRTSCLESIMTALSTSDIIIAFRSLLQTAEYLARLEFLQGDRTPLLDAYHVAKLRVEKLLRPAT